MSNNSPRAVCAYLDRHDLSDGVRLVAARTSQDPRLLKPSPHLVDEALRGVNGDRTFTTLVGDSLPTSRPLTAPGLAASATQTSLASLNK